MGENFRLGFWPIRVFFAGFWSFCTHLREEVYCWVGRFFTPGSGYSASTKAMSQSRNAVSDQYLRFVCVCRVGARRI
jgi:hypothetical protein